MNRAELEAKTVDELRSLCVRFGIVGMSKKRKDIIVDALLAYYRKEASPSKSATGSQNLDEMRSVFHSKVTSPGAAAGNKTTTTILVSCGAAYGNFPVVGKTVGAVAEFLREVLNVDRMSRGVVNGKEVEDSYRLKEGDNLEFLKPAGRKG
jgi:molybdopterin converting factor small subunit